MWKNFKKFYKNVGVAGKVWVYQYIFQVWAWQFSASVRVGGTVGWR